MAIFLLVVMGVEVVVPVDGVAGFVVYVRVVCVDFLIGCVVEVVSGWHDDLKRFPMRFLVAFVVFSEVQTLMIVILVSGSSEMVAGT